VDERVEAIKQWRKEYYAAVRRDPNNKMTRLQIRTHFLNERVSTAMTVAILYLI
jgi:hypothetical protein